MMIFCFSCLFCTMSKLNVLFFGKRTKDYPVHPSTFQIPLPPPLCLHTHTNSESMKQPFATNPFVFTPPFPLNNVPKPNPQASSTNQGHLLAANPSAAKRPTSHQVTLKRNSSHNFLKWDRTMEMHPKQTISLDLHRFHSQPNSMSVPNHLWHQGAKLWLHHHGRFFSPSAFSGPSSAFNRGTQPSFSTPPPPPF